MKQCVLDPKGLLEEARDQDGLDRQASAIMISNLDATTLPACIGTPVDEIGSTDVHLLSFVLDESASMGDVNDEVIAGFNQMITDLRQAKLASEILVQVWAFNTRSRLVFGWTPLPQVPTLDRRTYAPNGCTALYDAGLDALTSLVTYTQQLARSGDFVKSRVIIFSDGDDNSSARDAEQNVATVAQALLRQENFILAYAGFNHLTDHRSIAARLRFPNVLIPSPDPTTGAIDRNDPKAIRQIFQASSASLIRASRTTADPDSANTFFGP